MSNLQFVNSVTVNTNGLIVITADIPRVYISDDKHAEMLKARLWASVDSLLRNTQPSRDVATASIAEAWYTEAQRRFVAGEKFSGVKLAAEIKGVKNGNQVMSDILNDLVKKSDVDFNVIYKAVPKRFENYVSKLAARRTFDKLAKIKPGDFRKLFHKETPPEVIFALWVYNFWRHAKAKRDNRTFNYGGIRKARRKLHSLVYKTCKVTPETSDNIRHDVDKSISVMLNEFDRVKSIIRDEEFAKIKAKLLEG